MDLNLKSCHAALAYRQRHLIDINSLVYQAKESLPPPPDRHLTPCTWTADNWKWFYEKMRIPTKPFHKVKQN